jgi:hypothetical protein
MAWVMLERVRSFTDRSDEVSVLSRSSPFGAVTRMDVTSRRTWWIVSFEPIPPTHPFTSDMDRPATSAARSRMARHTRAFRSQFSPPTSAFPGMNA